MLPAQRGDALWITYGTNMRHHVLVDAGPQETIPTVVPQIEERIATLTGTTNRVDLFVVTHIDADHIQGAVSLLSDKRRVPLFADIWFNGFEHHKTGRRKSKMLGGPDAERLSTPLIAHPNRWNRAFGGARVAVAPEGALPKVKLPGGMEITLLAPDPARMAKLIPEWVKTCQRAGIDPGKGAPKIPSSWRRDRMLGKPRFDPETIANTRFYPDRSIPNGAGIAFVAEYEHKRVLFAADCPASAIIAGLDRMSPDRAPIDFDAVKLAHHGSRFNTNLELCERIKCGKWLVSTNGARFGHPDPECLARVIVTQRKPTFYLNYVTDQVKDLIKNAGPRYSVRLPRQNADGTYKEGMVVTV
jgi:hypothetical protein